MTDRAHTNPGIGELITNDWDDGTYATLNNAALVISGDRVAWTGPASRAPAADRADRTALTNYPGLTLRGINSTATGRLPYRAERSGG